MCGKIPLRKPQRPDKRSKSCNAPRRVRGMTEKPTIKGPQGHMKTTTSPQIASQEYSKAFGKSPGHSRAAPIQPSQLEGLWVFSTSWEPVVIVSRYNNQAYPSIVKGGTIVPLFWMIAAATVYCIDGRRRDCPDGRRRDRPDGRSRARLKGRGRSRLDGRGGRRLPLV